MPLSMSAEVEEARRELIPYRFRGRQETRGRRLESGRRDAEVARMGFGDGCVRPVGRARAHWHDGRGRMSGV